MTNVTFFLAEGLPVGFSASGHTGFAEQGSDIVCAAVSALCQTAVLGLERVAQVPAEIRREDESGFLEALIGSQADARALREAQVILRTLEEGIHDIEQQYPAFVRVTHRERRQKP